MRNPPGIVKSRQRLPHITHIARPNGNSIKRFRARFVNRRSQIQDRLGPETLQKMWRRVQEYLRDRPVFGQKRGNG